MNPVMHIIKEEQSDSLLEAGILRALVYFDIFNYPLTLQEIILFCDIKPSSLHEVKATLDGLCDRLLVFRFDDLYAIHNTIGLADRRRNGNKSASKAMAKAIRRGKLIQSFPFVRSVSISGSLSKNYFDESTDVDFFVITAPNRIWVTRLLLTVFKKVCLANRRKYFCVNYYIDTTQLTIPDKNLFAATEIVTLKYITGADVFRSFISGNDWVKSYFPNYEPAPLLGERKSTSFIKKCFEVILGGKFGNKVDTACFKVMQFFLKRKYNYLSSEKYAVNMRTQKHASKHHPQGFQFKVLEAFETGCRQFEQKHGIPLL